MKCQSLFTEYKFIFFNIQFCTCADSQQLDYSPTLSNLVSKDDIVQMKLVRVPFVHRATAVFVDNQGLNFAVLQADPNAW